MKRTLATIFATITGLVLLLSFKTHPVTSPQAITTDTTSTTTTPGTLPTSTLPGSPTTTTTPSTTKTVTGASASTHYGPVQVAVTVSGSQITNVVATNYPHNNSRDASINAYAIPQLVSETLSAQSANIDSVSGATYTSDGFIKSLQSALSKA